MHGDKVNQLLRNELSSVETYRQALDKRLILRRNEAIRERERRRREDKLQCLQERIAQRNVLVQTWSRANPEVGLRYLEHWVKRHKLNAVVTLKLEGRRIEFTVD